MMNIISLFKSIYFNFHYLPAKAAIRLPVRVHSSVKFGNMGKKGSVVLEKNCRVMLGFGQSFGLGRTTYWKLGDNGKVVFKGNARLGRGTQVIADGNITFGEGFYCNADCIINSGKSITFGDNCLLGWNVEIIDGDGHSILHSGVKSDKYKEIEIGDHVWIGANSMLLKGTKISNDSVIAAKSCVTKVFTESNVIIGNNKVIASDITWEK